MQVEVKRAQAGDIPVIEAILRDVAEMCIRDSPADRRGNGGRAAFPAAVRGIKQNRPQANSERTAEVSRTANVKSFGKPVYSMGRQPENMQRKLFSPGEPVQFFKAPLLSAAAQTGLAAEALRAPAGIDIFVKY